MMAEQRGFTMVEILISLLVMGFAVNGLLTLLHWGQLRYEAITDGPRLRGALGTLRRTVRSQVMAGIPHHLPAGLGNLRVASISYRPYDAETVMVQAALFEDRNGDGHQQSSEALPPVLWCFRTRAEGGAP